MSDPSTWPPALVLLIAGLAVHRVTRLLIADKITDPLRGRLTFTSTGGYRPTLGYLLSCPWCVSVYVAAAMATALAVAGWPGWLAWPATAAAWSTLTGWIAGHETTGGG